MQKEITGGVDVGPQLREGSMLSTYALAQKTK